MNLARYYFGKIIQKQLGSQLIHYRKKYWWDLNLAIAWWFANSSNLVPRQYLFLYGIYFRIYQFSSCFVDGYLVLCTCFFCFSAVLLHYCQPAWLQCSNSVLSWWKTQSSPNCSTWLHPSNPCVICCVDLHYIVRSWLFYCIFFYFVTWAFKNVTLPSSLNSIQINLLNLGHFASPSGTRHFNIW